jgi:dGTPase
MGLFSLITRQDQERREYELLSPSATKSGESKGRVRPEEDDRFRTAFQRDRDRIIHCKAFRRLKHKTQVFIAPFGDHYRTRLTHTLEVAQISRTVARALALNDDLVEACALGHDLGHTPFGHLGERVLSEYLGRPFVHSEQSLRVVEVLEKDGAGLNLTFEVRDGIAHHSWSRPEPETPEGWVVRYCDRIAYLCHDVDDGLRAGIITLEELPKSAREILGDGYSERIATLVNDLISTSAESGAIGLSDPVAQAMDELREFMFERVYLSEGILATQGQAQHVLESLLDYFTKHPDEISGQHRVMGDPVEIQVADYVSGMTDRYAIELYKKLFVPVGFV